MEEFLNEAEVFFEENLFSIGKNFSREKAEFEKYGEILSKLSEEKSAEIVDLAVTYIETFKNRSLEIEENIKFENELSVLSSGLTNNEYNFLRNIIFKEAYKSTHDILEIDVYEKWLNLQKLKHKNAISLRSQILKQKKEAKRGNPNFEKTISQKLLKKIIDRSNELIVESDDYKVKRKGSKISNELLAQLSVEFEIPETTIWENLPSDWRNK